MKIADLYIRVSTDEQAEKGYSQRDQEDRLRKYCSINNIEVRKIIREDHSAKTFNRPEWKKLLVDLKKNRGKIDLILFIKWDRFSRNAGDAYQMIGTLRKLGVEPQAVEQPLDLSVPENKMMLAFYLAAPEVENDRRALNTFHGMRRAKKEGRWMATAPMGYINTKINGIKIISPDPPKSDIIAWAFLELSKGLYSIKHVWREVNKRGYKCSAAAFERAIRNPVYCGLIRIPKYLDEEAHEVVGQHQPIISKELFYQVQDVINGRSRSLILREDAEEVFPLRGFLICPKCGNHITGSTSKGKTKSYHYYHCRSSCGVRAQTKFVDEDIVSILKQYELNPKIKTLIDVIFRQIFNSKTSAFKVEINQAKKQLLDEQLRIKKGRDLLLDGDMDASDYREIKSEAEGRIDRLESKIANLESSQLSYNPAILDKLCRLSEIYQYGTSDEVRYVVSSTFMEKLTLTKIECRTLKINPVLELIKLINNKLQGEKNEAKLDISALPLWVTPEIQKSNSFAHGMKLLEILAA